MFKPKNPCWDATDWTWLVVLIAGTTAFVYGMAYVTPTWWLPRLLAAIDLVWLVFGWCFALCWWRRVPK